MADGVVLNPGTGGATVDTETNAGRGNAQMQRMKLVLGDVDTDAGDVALDNPMPVGIGASFFTDSTANSSNAQLAPNAQFTGAIETVFNQPNASILLVSDQPGLLTINQYIDGAGTQLAAQFVFPVLAGVGLARSIVLNGNYVNATFINTGFATTTTFRLDVAYGNLQVADNAGNALVNIYGSQDLNGVSLIEEAIKGELPLSVQVTNPELRDPNGAMVLSDAPREIILWGSVNQQLIIDTTGYQSLAITTAALAGTVTTSNDGVTWSALTGIPIVLGAYVTAVTANAGFMFPCVARYIRITVTTLGSAKAYLRNQPAPMSYTTSGVLATVTNLTTVATVTSLSQIATKAPLVSTVGNGSTGFPLGVSQVTAVSQVDQNATAFAGAGSVLGTVVASAQGGGGVISAEINVSALTLGTATAVFLILQESRGGTNFSDIWTSDPITATGIQSMPAIPVAGRRRWRAFSCGGTSTTVTVTITSLELPTGSYVLQRQARDFYAATNPLASQFNSVALTASNFVLTTLSTATTPMYVEGTKLITAFMLLAGGPTVTTQPVVTMQGSFDGANWVTITGATMTAAGNGLYSVSTANTAFKFVRLQVTTAAVYGSGSYTITNIGVQAVN